MVTEFVPGGHLVFYARLSQILFSIIVMAMAAALAVQTSWDTWSGTAAGCSAIIALCGAVGMFAFRRPRDCHWHLTVAFDGLALIMSVMTVMCTTTTAAGWNDSYYVRKEFKPTMVATTVLSYILLSAIFIPIVRTYRLQMAGKLPAPGATRVESYRLDEQGSPNTPPRQDTA